MLDERIYWTSKRLEEKLYHLERQVMQTAVGGRSTEQSSRTRKCTTSDNLNDLMTRRRNLAGIDIRGWQSATKSRENLGASQKMRNEQILERPQRVKGLKHVGAIWANSNRTLH